MRELRVSINFVLAWTKAPDQDLTVDARGWQRGRPRHHPRTLRSRILALRQHLEEDPTEFYVGDDAIQQDYEERYPNDPLPSTKHITAILRDAGLTATPQKKRRGTARYLCYPEQCILRLGKRIAEADFIGEKFIAGVHDPLHFLSVAYRKPAKLRRILRTETETTPEAIGATTAIFDAIGWPDVVRVDAGNVFSGRGERLDGKGQRSISTFAQFLLERAIIPVYGAIRSPWNQAYVEGSNSVFGRNFWNARTFTSLADVDRQLAAFNSCSLKRARWTPWNRPNLGRSFSPRICFIRKVEEDPQTHEGRITIASTIVLIRESYIGLFVFVEWNLEFERLTIRFERDGAITTISEQRFLIHPISRKKCSHFIG